MESLNHSQTSMKRGRLLSVVVLIGLATSSCGGGSNTGGTTPPPTQQQAATPTITTVAAQNGAQIVSIADSTSGAKIYFTVDGSTPTASSPQYLAPVLITSNVTLKAVAIASGFTNSTAASQSFSSSIASGTLVWSDEFSNTTGANAQPDPNTWTYDTGNSGFGNNELENYCAWGSTASPCDSNSPNAYVGTDGYLHIVARQPATNTYTSARLKSQGLFSLNYGRIEARIQLPEGQGLWPAFWMLGNNIATVNWPACGEQDIMEHINAPLPDWVAGSIHGTNLNGGHNFPDAGQSFSASDWHVYGMIWSQGHVSFYVDSPANVYSSFDSTTAGGTWPFDSGTGNFIILNLAVGGNWPGSPNAGTPFPSEMLVDYVRVYTN